MLSDYRKIVILIVLLVPCVWLVRRNLFPPAPATADSGATVAAGSARENDSPGATGSSRGSRGSTGQAMVDVDPTLRRDLLEASRSVEYSGNSRNIFEFYTPPAPPPSPIHAAPPPPQDPVVELGSSKPKAPTIDLKFYGTAQREGGPRRAFLTDGEEIMIAQEGEVVAIFYKVNRIGVSSLELEDTRSNEKQQLTLIEE